MIQSNTINSLINYSKINLDTIPIDDIIEIFNNKKKKFLAYKKHKLFWEQISNNNTIIDLYLNENHSFSLKPKNFIYKALAEREIPFVRLIFPHNNSHLGINLPDSEKVGIQSDFLYEYFINEIPKSVLKEKLLKHILDLINTQIYEYKLESLGKIKTAFFQKNPSLLELVNETELVFLLEDVFFRKITTNYFIQNYILYKVNIIIFFKDKSNSSDVNYCLLEKNDTTINIVEKILDRLNGRELNADILSTKLYAYAILYSLKYNMINNELRTKLLNMIDFIDLIYQLNVIPFKEFEDIFVRNGIDLTAKLKYNVSIFNATFKDMKDIPPKYINRIILINRGMYENLKISFFEKIIQLIIEGSTITIDTSHETFINSDTEISKKLTQDLLEYAPIFSEAYDMSEEKFLDLISEKLYFQEKL